MKVNGPEGEIVSRKNYEKVSPAVTASSDSPVGWGAALGRTARAESAPWLSLTNSNKGKGPHKEIYSFVNGTEMRMPGREAINSQAFARCI